MKTFRIVLILFILGSCKQTESPTETASSFSNLRLPEYSRKQLESDFDLLVNSLKEAHTGLYWYATEKQFDSIVRHQRSLLRDSLNGLEFYNIVSPIVAFTKEDHCDIGLSEEIKEALAEKGLYLPLSVIHLRHKTLIINTILPGKPEGMELLEVNGIGIKGIRERLFRTFAADGFILSSKYRYLDFVGFSREYARVIGQEKENSITVFNPVTQRKEHYTIKSIPAKELVEIQKKVFRENNIRREIGKPAQLEFPDDRTALLTFRTFSNSDFEESGMEFRSFVDSCFQAIRNKGIAHLILDMRDNGGGSEGNEDILFSYLTDRPYTKYKYVELSALTYSFFAYTDYAKTEDRLELERELKTDHMRSSDGRYYRKTGIYVPEPVKKTPFKGNISVLTSGWTYSGGAEFSSLMKEHTNAVFIGEEVGGGFYGNTSGISLELTLPATKLVIDIPILRFVLDVKKGKFGRGVIPDHAIEPTFQQFIKGYDAELEYAKKRF